MYLTCEIGKIEDRRALSWEAGNCSPLRCLRYRRRFLFGIKMLAAYLRAGRVVRGLET